jgi:hypothetical protein
MHLRKAGATGSCRDVAQLEGLFNTGHAQEVA